MKLDDFELRSSVWRRDDSSNHNFGDDVFLLKFFDIWNFSFELRLKVSTDM